MAAAFLLLAPGSPSLFAQELNVGQGLDLPGGTGGLGVSPSFIQRSDVLLGTLFISSLILIDSFEGLDEHANRRLSADMDERGTAIRRVGRALGDMRVGLGLTAGTILVGQLGGQSRVREIGLHALESVLVANGLAQVFKIAVGRARPDESPGNSDVLRPFRLDNDFHSFPSGHSAQVFALATTLSRELRDEAPWLPFVVYPLATWTATSRVLDRRHWLTDVGAGAALGILSARWVERWNHGASAGHGLSWRIAPGPEGGVGIGLTIGAR